jgi:SH3-like domain-containing protein
MRARSAGLLILALLATPAGAQEKAPPYWASIASGKAMMRAGPGRNYPGIWLYQRRDLPIRVLKTFPNWRLVEDPDGAKGWMLVSLLSDRRTAMVKAGDPRPVRTNPSVSARVRYLAEAGVVGRIEKCRDGFCRIEIGSKKGFIATSDIYGLSPGETLDD